MTTHINEEINKNIDCKRKREKDFFLFFNNFPSILILACFRSFFPFDFCICNKN